ncbi:MAG TPA: DUF6159 family protein [Steroidobacteraceae bacterium]|jgi:hypothetical protein
MLERFSRSWQILQASAAVLRQDRELLLFPFFSGLATLLVAATFLVPLAMTGALEGTSQTGVSAGFLLTVFAFYLIQYFIIFFFNTALVGAALIRLDGGDPTVADGLKIARDRVWRILGYAGIAATVGLILRAIEERAGFLGRWIVAFLGVAFTVATFLTIPILVTRDVGPVEAVKESAALLKRTWGENIIGNAGLGVVFFVAYFSIALLAIMLIPAAAPSVVGVVTVCTLLIGVTLVLALFQAALQGIYSAALYRYATQGDAGASFDRAMLIEAFRPKS